MSVPASASTPPRDGQHYAAERRLDAWEATPRFAALDTQERIAAYLNSIRRMVAVLVVVMVLGLVAAVVLGLMVIGAIHAGHQPIGLTLGGQ